jgi:hypothetical protein
MTANYPSGSDQAVASIDVDPKVAAAFAAWATELAGRAVWVSGRTTVPEWVGTAAELLYDWAAGVPWANGQVGMAGQAGIPTTTGVAGTHGAFLGGMLAATPPSSSDQLGEPPISGRTPLEQLRAARLAVGVADALVVALRAGDAEQASRTYHVTAGEDLGDDPDQGAGS